MKSLADMLRWEAEAWERLGISREENLRAAVLEHGQAYEVDREASAKLDKGPLRNCFGNAAMAAMFYDELTYVEGFAGRGPILAHHAWVVNREGRALEVTWRDGGYECGFCVDGVRERSVDEEGYDEDDETTWHEACRLCGGTGTREDEHPTLEHAQYYGIAVDDDTVRAITHRNGLWGVLHSPRDLAEILSARR